MLFLLCLYINFTVNKYIYILVINWALKLENVKAIQIFFNLRLQKDLWSKEEKTHIQENESAHVSEENCFEITQKQPRVYSVKMPIEVFVSKTGVILQLFSLHIIINFPVYKSIFFCFC